MARVSEISATNQPLSRPDPRGHLESVSARATTGRLTVLVGRRDLPTDGVEDYCKFLVKALCQSGWEGEWLRVPWAEQGWRSALRWLRGRAANWRGEWVVLQYTALAWSHRGLPLGLVGLLRVLRRNQVRLAVVFHDPAVYGGTRLVDRLRRAGQLWVMQRLYQQAERAVFTAPLDRVTWLPVNPRKASFIPIGANLAAPARHESPSVTDGARTKTIAVYGITGAPQLDQEVREIAQVVRNIPSHVSNLRLVVFGRGASEAQAGLESAFAGTKVELSVLGILPQEEVARVLLSADVLLFVRGGIANHRGSAIAGIVCGLPVVGYAGPGTAPPITEAGVLLAQEGDRDGLSAALRCVLTDEALCEELRAKSCAAARRHFAWEAIAARFNGVLGNP